MSQLVPAFMLKEYRPGDEPTGGGFHHEIEVWHSRNSLSSAEAERLGTVLSPDELERAARFRFEVDRKTYITARGGLRYLLEQYLSIPAARIRFKYSGYGKPNLDQELDSNGLEFNVSHSGEFILWAFTTGRRIGVDVEKIRSNFDAGEIAERFFSPAERAALRRLPLGQRHEAFFRCWTRKEAFIKALGEGLSHALDSFDVSLEPGNGVRLLATRPDAREAARWSLWDVTLPSGYAAALATDRTASTA
jgi:4'-phosphopantetheinyl transferase